MNIQKVLLMAILIAQLFEAYTRHNELWRLILGLCIILLLLIYSIWGGKEGTTKGSKEGGADY